MEVMTQIEGKVVEVGVGSILWLESGRVEKLEECDWDGAAFRFPHAFQPNPSLAVNVAITGRTFQRKGETYWVKVQIEWVGDGEESRYSSAWLKANPYALPAAFSRID